MIFSCHHDILFTGMCNYVTQVIVDVVKGKYYGDFLQWLMENVNR